MFCWNWLWGQDILWGGIFHESCSVLRMTWRRIVFPVNLKWQYCTMAVVLTAYMQYKVFSNIHLVMCLCAVHDIKSNCMFQRCRCEQWWQEAHTRLKRCSCLIKQNNNYFVWISKVKAVSTCEVVSPVTYSVTLFPPGGPTWTHTPTVTVTSCGTKTTSASK